jgi:hypothetical protein
MCLINHYNNISNLLKVKINHNLLVELSLWPLFRRQQIACSKLWLIVILRKYFSPIFYQFSLIHTHNWLVPICHHSFFSIHWLFFNFPFSKNNYPPLYSSLYKKRCLSCSSVFLILSISGILIQYLKTFCNL